MVLTPGEGEEVLEQGDAQTPLMVLRDIETGCLKRFSQPGFKEALHLLRTSSPIVRMGLGIGGCGYMGLRRGGVIRMWLRWSGLLVWG